ncbi:MAG TPA: Calx-beta domain-containing protein [Thermoanaerobaculia bacterium]|nr:Calx-beta domain-containing protein [Thermoanaerobaculia bacterium]
MTSIRPVLATALVLSLAGPVSAATIDVTVGPGLSFSPATVTIQVGDTVRWTNVGGGFHNVRADDDSFRCASGCDGQGGDGDPATSAWTASITFNAAGIHPYYCEVHSLPGASGMNGMVIVQEGGVPGSIRFSSPSYSVQENASNATVTIQRVGGDDGMVSVSFATSNGTASQGLDYMAVSTTVTWADNDDNPKTVQVPIVDDALDEPNESVGLNLSAPTGGATLGSPASATLTIADNDNPPGGPCVADANTLCLLGDRFRLQIQFRTSQGQMGMGLAEELRDFSGSFSFFNPDNLEMLVKVIDACALNNRYWLFYGATTNVEFNLLVTDTLRNVTQVYPNPLNTAALPIQDTDAFATCP